MFLDHEKLSRTVSSNLLHPEFPTSSLVIVPPTFGGDELAECIGSAVADHPTSPPVAIISADEFPDADGYAASLATKWRVRTSTPPRNPAEASESYFRRLFAVGTPERPLVQIVVRFDKILDCVDSWVLGLMRTEEQSRRLRSVILCPYPYSELKRRWVTRGVKLTNSDYGDKHELHYIPLSSLQWLRSRRVDPPVPPHIFEYALSVAGPYPETLGDVLETWVRLGRSDSLGRALQTELREKAVSSTLPLIRKLDAPGQTTYVEHLIDLHLHAQSNAQFYMRQHPWAHYLIGSDGEPRSECLGEAAQRFWKLEVGHTALESIHLRARRLYECRQYGAAVELTELLSRGDWPPIHQLVAQHARIMFSLLGGCGNEAAGEDSDWEAVLRCVQDARQLLLRVHLDQLEREMIECRYDELDAVARSVCSAKAGGQSRIVDRLGGLAVGGCAPSPRTALLLVLCGVEAGRALTGNASAIRAVLPLPEQIYRLWAFWQLGLNYYEAQETRDEIWEIVCREWPHGALTRPTPRQAFSSFELFSYYAMATAGDRELRGSPEPSWKSLRQSLSLLEIRRDVAHAVVTNDPKRRAAYFELIDRWLSALIVACPEPVSRDQLLAVIEPILLPSAKSEGGGAGWRDHDR
jgi:hypothetical protein